MEFNEVKLSKFKCPIGLSNKKALCPTCKQEEKCKEQLIKRYPGACGCGGNFDCKCGFFYAYCMGPYENEISCPYCKRKITKQTNLSMSSLGEIKIVLPKMNKFVIRSD